MLYKKDGLILYDEEIEIDDNDTSNMQNYTLSIIEGWKYKSKNLKIKKLKPTDTNIDEIKRYISKAESCLKTVNSTPIEQYDDIKWQLLHNSILELNKMLFECEKIEKQNTQLQLGLLVENLKKQSENIETLSSSMVYLVQLLNGKVENNQNE